MKIGVFALQGAFARHQYIFSKLAVETVQIRRADQLTNIKALVMPGGESTTLLKLLNDYDFIKALGQFRDKGGAFFGTCAGAILLGKSHNSNEQRLEYIDVYLERNAYGRQIDSFKSDIFIESFNSKPFEGIFIRAPKITKISKDVKVLAKEKDIPVLLHSNQVLISTFHPELTEDVRIHQYFLEHVVLLE